jgi:hypothetical protein
LCAFKSSLFSLLCASKNSFSDPKSFFKFFKSNRHVHFRFKVVNVVGGCIVSSIIIHFRYY